MGTPTGLSKGPALRVPKITERLNFDDSNLEGIHDGLELDQGEETEKQSNEELVQEQKELSKVPEITNEIEQGQLEQNLEQPEEMNENELEDENNEPFDETHEESRQESPTVYTEQA